MAKRIVAWPIKQFADTRVPKHAGEKVYQNNRRYIDGLGVASIVAKDGLGCYLYVTQSLNNKEIPDDKRKFVASLDLTNGGLMILFQILMFFTVNHKVCQTAMFDKLFGKMFDRPIQKMYMRLTKAKFDKNNVNINGMKFSEEFNKIRGNVKDAFGGLTSLVAATIVGKRMLVPFVATPLADKVEKWMNKREAEKDAVSFENKTDDKSDPSMQGAGVNVEEAAADTAPKTSFDTGSTNLLDKYRK